ncbi:MAG TPA: hypothetical protein VFL28_11330 [bacterium]|nr:hypothetical protein [bacterium]
MLFVHLLIVHSSIQFLLLYSFALTLDVVIPSLRRDSVGGALYSLGRGTAVPDLITIVSNEVAPSLVPVGLRVRLVRFRSARYPIGTMDVALRRNIGIWASPCSHIITFDDDQLASPDMVEAGARLFERQAFFWGHYRFLDFAVRPVDEILQLPASAGRPREFPPNAWHGWQSAYGGLFGGEKSMLQAAGGFDLAYCGRHAGEDQHLGRRLADAAGHAGRVFVHEPPFAWHPTAKVPWSAPAYTNTCAGPHQFEEHRLGAVSVQQCRVCPYFQPPPGDVPTGEVLMRFDPAAVDVTVEDAAAR